MAEYFRRGVSTVVWLTVAPAALAAPTQAELTAGSDITSQVADLAGWDFSNAPITTPKLSTTFDTSIVGPDTTGGPEITFYDSDTAPVPNPRTLLAKGNVGWMCLLPTGQAATKPSNIFPVTSTGVNDEWTLGAEAAKFKVQLAVSTAPTLDGAQAV